MDKLKFVLFTLLISIISSCETNIIDDTGNAIAGVDFPTTEATDNYSVTYQYKDGVIVLDEKSQAYLIKVESDSILYFSTNTPAAFLPSVGDVISARVTEKTPYGLGNVVLEKSESEGMIRCVTSVTELDNIFEELSFEYNTTLTDSILDGYTDKEGNFIEPSFVWYDVEGDSIVSDNLQENSKSSNVQSRGIGNDTRATIGRQKLVTWPLKAEKGGVRLTGDISLGAFVHCSGDIKKNSFDFYVQPVIDISALSKIGVMYNPNLYQDIDEYSIFNLKDIVKGVIQLGPVTLRPYVDVETYVDFGASGTVDMAFGKTFSAKIGYSQQEGGYIKNSTSDGPENKLIKSVSLDGNISIGFRCLFDVGCGLYTKNIALALDPYFKYSLGADCRLTGNETGWRASSKINFDINVGANGRLAVNWFGGIKLSPTLKFFDTNLYHKEWPILPVVDENTFSVKRDKSSNSLIFDAKYDITGGLLSMFDNIYPEIAVYKGGEFIYKKTYSNKTKYNQKQNVTFRLDGLKEDVAYTAKPIITINGVDLELDGIPFSSTSPTASVTDIVQTDAEFGIFQHNGHDYSYRFKFYVNAHLIGSENCNEWGLYDPNSDRVYNSYELKDGRHTSYWTGWSNNPSATWTKTPYVILLDGNYKMFESHTHTCNYGWGNYAAKSRMMMGGDNDMVVEMDSVVYHK